MTDTGRYIVAGSRAWNRRVFDEVAGNFRGDWRYIGAPDELSPEFLASYSPNYIFFLHWSNKVPAHVFDNYECVVFHMTDLPYGRGGSPLQNLIERGYATTKLTALRMVEEFDAGPFYLKENLSLDGNAEEIYIRASRISMHMAYQIVQDGIEPVPQFGKPVVFKRRKPEQSYIGCKDDLNSLYDFIRMLDAEGYPHAYIEHNGFRYEFRRAGLYNGRIVADVTITPVEAEAI